MVNNLGLILFQYTSIFLSYHQANLKMNIKKGKTLPIEAGFACLTSYNPYHHNITWLCICKEI